MPTPTPGCTYIVVCLEHEIGYVLATRQTFDNHAAAAMYASTVSDSRKPLVVEGRWFDLRKPERLTAYVNVYAVSRSYGGPEEGGWWFDVGRVVDTIKCEQGEDEAAMVKLRLEREHGIEHDARGKRVYVSQGRYSVNGGEDIEIEISDTPGTDYPSERPHYE